MTLQGFFTQYPKTALAFSGGVDSSYLLYAARQYAQKVSAYYVKSQFQPQFEMDDAIRLTSWLGIELHVLPADILSVPHVAENPQDRCYFCKQAIFSTIMKAAAADGYSVLLDGTNASDEEGDRPGMRALRELSVLSPLRLCGLTKQDVRNLSRAAGLFTWNKHAYACLATRIPTGEFITHRKLEAAEEAESFLSSLGFSDFRVRSSNGTAKIFLREEQMQLLLQHRSEILKKLKEYYHSVTMDLEARGEYRYS